MAKKEEILGGRQSFQISDQLAAIARANPGIDLSADDVRNANNGTLVLVGLGSILPSGPAGNFGLGSGGGSQPVPIGCIEYMQSLVSGYRPRGCR